MRRDWGLAALRWHRLPIALAVSEACTNVVMHAYVSAAAPGSLTVEASQRNGELVVAVRDEGQGMLPRPDSPGLGLGLSIIGRLLLSTRVYEGSPTPPFGSKPPQFARAAFRLLAEGAQL